MPDALAREYLLVPIPRCQWEQESYLRYHLYFCVVYFRNCANDQYEPIQEVGGAFSEN